MKILLLVLNLSIVLRILLLIFVVIVLGELSWYKLKLVKVAYYNDLRNIYYCC